MAHKKLTIPKCLACGKRLTPSFRGNYGGTFGSEDYKFAKIGIQYFGKHGTDSMLCSDSCGVGLLKLILSKKDFDQRDYRRLRQLQLRRCRDACEERGFKEDAAIWQRRYDEFCKEHNYK